MGQRIAQKSRAPPTPRQHCCERSHIGVHIGGGVALHVSLTAIQARRASQQYVPAPHSARAQNEVEPLSVTPLSRAPGQVPAGVQNCPNIVSQHS